MSAQTQGLTPGAPREMVDELIALIDAVPKKERWRVLFPVIRRLQWVEKAYPGSFALLHGFLIGSRLKAEEDGLKQTCRFCGCTEKDACDGGCSWVDRDVCSACGARMSAEAVARMAEGVVS